MTVISKTVASTTFLSACAVLASQSMATAAEITHENLNTTTEIIFIDGDIASGDVERFRQISLRYPKALVVLDSDGGLLHPAIEMGKIIKIMGYTTLVDVDGVCASACALIWLAGDRRIQFTGGGIGFHAAYVNESGRPIESGVANALVGNYLTLLGASAKTVVFATTAPPDRLLWLSAANKDMAGIDFEIITPAKRQTPASMVKPGYVDDEGDGWKYSDVPSPPPPKFVPPAPQWTPLAPDLSQPGSPRGNPAQWLKADDYPEKAWRKRRVGTTGFRVTYDAYGQPTKCEVTSSSGHADLDTQTCYVVYRSAKFNPGRDRAGNPVGGSYSNRIRWGNPYPPAE